MKRHLKAGAAAAAAAVLIVALPYSARAQEPLRSGRILAVSADTSDYTWLWPWEGCGGSLECWGWVQSYCNADLAGRDVAVMSSIESVSDLSDGVTPRTLEVNATGGLRSGRLIVEFWKDNCGFLPVAPDNGHIECTPDCPSLVIPPEAHWMTITSKPGNANVEWILR